MQVLDSPFFIEKMEIGMGMGMEMEMETVYVLLLAMVATLFN